MTLRASLIWDVGALLGEGPVWLPNEGALRFVDIKSGHVHRYAPSSGDRHTQVIGGKPSFILPAEDRALVVGSGACVHMLTAEGLGPSLVTAPMPAHNRTNDATVDCFGRLWFGTMDDEEQIPTGKIYCFEGGVLHCVDCDAVVTNGPAVSADGQVLYRVDSGARTIWRHHIVDGPRLSPGEVFVQLSAADGHPDGITLDSEDCLWVALWDGWSVRRYSPTGALVQQVDLPCARVTKIAFGGEDLSTAYVTTARVGLSEAQRTEQFLAGGLFAFDAPAPGRVTPAMKLKS